MAFAPPAPTGPAAPAAPAMVPAAPATPAVPVAPDVSVLNVNPTAAVTVTDDVVPSPAGPVMPAGGFEKFWDAANGIYNWQGHATEQMWQRARGDNGDGHVTGLTPTTGTPGVPTPPAVPAAPAVPAPAVAPADAAAAATAVNAGIDLTAFNAYVAEHGVASPEHLATLAAAGVPNELVNDYVSQKLEAVTRHQTMVTEFMGGPAQLGKVDDWMQANMDAPAIAAFTKQMMDPNTWQATAGYLLQSAGLAQAGRGLVTTTPNAQPVAATNGENFATEAEFNTAMRHPSYKADPAYRARVSAALANSPALMKGSRHTAGA